MLLPLKAICTKSKARKDGTCVIFIQYCGAEDKKTLLNTGIAIPPTFWLKRSKCISDKLPECYGLAITLNERLGILIRLAEDIIKYGIKANVKDLVSYVKNIFNTYSHTLIDGSEFGRKVVEISKLKKSESFTKLIQPSSTVPTFISSPNQKDFHNPSEGLDLFEQFDDYMNSKKYKVTPGMLKLYDNTKGLLKQFEKFRGEKITFECIDFNFYDSFVSYLTNDHVHRRRKILKKGLKVNSIGKTIKHFRVFINDRVRRKIIAPIDLSDFKSKSEDADAIYLTPSEIERIYNATLPTHSSLEFYKDLLVLGCLTGLRFSDFSSISPEDIKGDMLYKKQQKSNSWVVIPLRPLAYHILVEKYKGRMPDTTNSEFNRHIKTVGQYSGILELIKFSYKKGNQDIIEVRPKSNWITSHTCRRSFCTNEFLAGTPVELIMKISGHKSLRDFYRYIRISPEEAGFRIKALWQKREEEAIELQKIVKRIN